MQIRKLATLGPLALALAMPGVSFAKNDKKADKNEGNGIGKGGVPALRDKIYEAIDDLQDQIDSALRRIRRLEHGLAETNTRVDALEGEVADLDTRLEALEGQFVDDDGDTFSEVQDDCDDSDPAVNPLAAEVPANHVDDDCDHLVDEV
jgi:septal ring factor EnvC (AmiA/AmiB activator)